MNKKMREFLKNKWILYGIAFLLPFIICVGICIVDGVYPFGDKCILHVDMYHQYCPFFTEFMNKLKNGGSLLYSWNIGLGSDFISLYAYYLASPLNWFLLLCPDAYVIEFMTITIILKIAFAGFSFYYFLYNFDSKNPKKLVGLVFSTAYALSGFVAAYSWDIMWMDCIALAPLVMLGLKYLVEKENPLLYYVTLSLSILANYYIAMMICAFLVFYFLLLVFEHRKNVLKSFGRFTIYSLLSGGTGAILLIPEMKILSYSGSSGINFPKENEWYFNFIEEIGRGCTSASAYTGALNWPNIYAGAFTLILLCMYIFNTRIPVKKKIPRLAMVGFFLVSFSNNYLDFIWHGLHFPDSLPARQSFLYIFVVLVLGYEAIKEFSGNKIWGIAASYVIVAALLFLGYTYGDETVTEKSAYIITMLFITCYSVIFVLFKLLTGENKEILREMFILLAVAELTVNMYLTGFYTLNRDGYVKRNDEYKELVQMAKEDALKEAQTDDESGVFYRIEDTERMTKNDSALYGYPSASQFSSLMNINVSHFYQTYNMEGGKNYYCYNGATPLTSAMLSVKYFISDDNSGDNVFRTFVGKSGDYCLYKNNYCLPIGFVIDEATAELFDIDTMAGLQAIDDLAYYLGADSDTFDEAEYDINCDSGSSTITINKDGYYYADTSGIRNSDSLTFTYPDGHSTRYSKTTHSYLFNLGYCRAGDTITVSNNSSEKVMFYVYKLNEKVIDDAFNTISSNKFELISKSDTSVKGKINMEEDGRMIFSIANEAGWKMYVDGEEVKITNFSDTFISANLKKGEHEIELRYFTPGLKVGALISGSCILIFVGLNFLRRKKSIVER